MRTIHRLLSVFAALPILFVALTGCLVQSVDLKSLLTHAPATDPNVQAMVEGLDGPGNFQVIAVPDYTAATLPDHFAFGAAFLRVARSTHAEAPGASLRFIELRMIDGKPVGQVRADNKILRFDAMSGAPLPLPAAQPGNHGPVASLRGELKSLHRFQAFGDNAMWLDILTGAAMFVMVITGLAQYFKMLNDRIAIGKSQPFWWSAGWLRSLHRIIALAAAAFVLLIATTGIWLTIDSLALGFYNAKLAATPGSGGPFHGTRVDVSSPLQDWQLRAMAGTTLDAYLSTVHEPVKVMRLRYFAGMPQGVVISGGGATRQFVFNAATGRSVGEYESGYPNTGFPDGWQFHETLKKIHRGDYFGIAGRWMDLLAGLSLAFLSISGLWMYGDLLLRRRRSGRNGLFWS